MFFVRRKKSRPSHTYKNDILSTYGVRTHLFEYSNIHQPEKVEPSGCFSSIRPAKRDHLTSMPRLEKLYLNIRKDMLPYYTTDSNRTFSYMFRDKSCATIHLRFERYLLSARSPSRTRTYDTSVNSRMLYQLSYKGICSISVAFTNGNAEVLFAILSSLQRPPFENNHVGIASTIFTRPISACKNWIIMCRQMYHMGFEPMTTRLKVECSTN